VCVCICSVYVCDVCMYVCVCMCECVRVSARTHARMYVFVYVCMYAWKAYSTRLATNNVMVIPLTIVLKYT